MELKEFRLVFQGSMHKVASFSGGGFEQTSLAFRRPTGRGSPVCAFRNAWILSKIGSSVQQR